MTDIEDIGVNTQDAFNQLQAVDEFSKQTALKVTGISRQLYDTVLIGLSFVGRTIDQSYQLMAQGAFAAAETVIAIRGAFAAGTFGASEALTGGLGIVTSLALFAHGFQLILQGDKAKEDIDQLILIGRLQQVSTASSIWRLR